RRLRVRRGFFVPARKRMRPMLVASASPLTPQGRKKPAEPTRPVFSNGLSGTGAAGIAHEYQAQEGLTFAR
ncbi:hypothetical protein, partial [Falsiroseomonas sp.]|uniref:hypothetical protein n=1 Tax=Falsiroseomonas sp. TaxID=2870721 RepID=UPI0034A0ECD1